jgi:alcohol dehydrogenase class IV
VEVKKLCIDLNIPATLREVGVAREMFPAIIKATMEYRLLAINPVKITAEDVAEILEKAY